MTRPRDMDPLRGAMEKANQGDEQGALAELERALVERSDEAPARRVRWQRNAALLCDRLGRLGAALSRYKEALRLEPLDGFLHLALADLYLRLGRAEDARRHRAEAEKLSRDDSELAEILRAQERDG